MPRTVLCITNGHGEDTVAAKLIGTIRSHDPSLHILALPLVGDGNHLEGSGAEILGPRRAMPSGGFIHHNIVGFLADIFLGGWIRSTWKQISILRRLRDSVDLVIAIGDMIPVFASSFVAAPLIVVGINKSDYYRYRGYSYMGFEIAYLRWRAAIVFPRDLPTTERLKRRGVKAQYVGNPMMDHISLNGSSTKKTKGMFTIGFLPGTRPGDIPKNLEDFERIALCLNQTDGRRERFEFLVASTELPPHRSATTVFRSLPFSDVVAKSDLIVGLSGTGNEQAAGCGIPIVAFPSRGGQYTSRYAKAQQQLLGAALALCPRDPHGVAKKILDILGDPVEREHMIQIGRERMGPIGAIPSIAKVIHNKIHAKNID